MATSVLLYASDVPNPGNKTQLIALQCDADGRLLVSSEAGAGGVATITTLQTSATGSNWVTFPAAACSEMDLMNNTGVTLEYRRGGAGAGFPILNQQARLIVALADASEISIRRVDLSNAQVVANAELFT